MHAQPTEQRDLQAMPGADPAADEIGQRPHGLVEQKQKRQIKGGETQPVEMQQHQHTQRPVGEGKAPIGAGHGGVVAKIVHQAILR